jgi:hypothetical protein
LKKFIHQTSIPHLWKTCLIVINVHVLHHHNFFFLFFKYTEQMLLMTSIKFCETSNDNTPLLVCVTLSDFIIPFNIALRMHTFIFLICLVSDQNTMNAHLKKGLMWWASCTCVCMFGSSSVENLIFKMCSLFPPNVPGF